MGRERDTLSHKLRQQGQVGVRNEKGASSQSSEAARQAGQHAAPRGHTAQQGRGRSRRCGKTMGDQGAGKETDLSWVSEPWNSSPGDDNFYISKANVCLHGLHGLPASFICYADCSGNTVPLTHSEFLRGFPHWASSSNLSVLPKERWVPSVAPLPLKIPSRS